MGCNISCKRLSSSSSKSPNLKRNIRIVHLNGYVTQLDYPATVAEVTGNNPPNKHFLFTHAQLLTNTSKPLKPDTVLEAGKIYFLLPYSLFNSGVSPMDLAPLAKKLASKAQNDHKFKSKSKKKCKMGGNSPVWISPANTSPNRLFSDREKENDHIGVQKSSKSRSWKPDLDTIREKSFNRRSESELLQENVKVDSEV